MTPLRRPEDMTNDEIDDLVDRWHGKGTGMALHQFLGFNYEDYKRWVEDPSICKPDVVSESKDKP